MAMREQNVKITAALLELGKSQAATQESPGHSSSEEKDVKWQF